MGGGDGFVVGAEEGVGLVGDFVEVLGCAFEGGVGVGHAEGGGCFGVVGWGLCWGWFLRDGLHVVSICVASSIVL